MTKLLLGFLVFTAAVGCVWGERARPAQRPLSSAETAMGYQDAVELGSSYMTDQSYTGVELHKAEELWPNVWRVRFGLAPKGSGRFVDLYFDGAKRVLLKKEEISGLGWGRTPDAGP